MDETIYKTSRERFNVKIKALQNAASILDELKDMPHVQCVNFWENELSIDIPYNLTMLNDIAAFLAERGFSEKSRLFLETHGVLLVFFMAPEVRCDVKVALGTNYTGSTCKLNKVGERTQPIFETVCLQS
jgi:hypothetical protein